MLQFDILSRYIVVLCVIFLFCIVITLSSVLLYHFVMIYRRFVCNNNVLCLVMLVRNNVKLFYR